MPSKLPIKKPKKIVVIAFIVLIAWVVFAQSCMKFRMSDSEAKKEFAEAGVTINIRNIQVNNKNLHYVITGNNNLPTIFFIHGSPGSWDAFKAYLKDKDLLQRFRMVSIDRPGFGYSNFGQALHLDEQSAIVNTLVQELQNKQQIYLVGHSLGGPLIVQMAADNPALFSGLVILAGSIDAKQEIPEKWRLLLMNNPLKLLVPGALKPSNDELWYLKKDLINLQPKFAAIKCPVYIIHGTKDQLVPYANMAFGVKMLTNAAKVDTITLQNVNHFIPWSNYEDIKKVLLGLGK